MKIILAALLLLVGLTGFESRAASGASGFVKIKTLRAGAGFIRITGETNFTDPSNCNGSVNSTVLVFDDTQSYSEIVSFLLAARLSGEPVQFWLSDCKIDSGKSYPRGTYLYL